MKKLLTILFFVLLLGSGSRALALVSGNVYCNSYVPDTINCLNTGNFVKWFNANDNAVANMMCLYNQTYENMIGCSANETWKVLEIDNPGNWLGCSTYNSCLPYSLDQSSVVWRSADWKPLQDTEIMSWGTEAVSSAKENIFALISNNKDLILEIFALIITIYLFIRWIKYVAGK